MPVIKINEFEEISYAAFDATENTALIPMLYYRTYATRKVVDSEGKETGVIEPVKDSEGNFIYDSYNDSGIKYTNFKKFKEDMDAHYMIVDNEVDKSYIMAYELLLQGMGVVIKPVIFDNGKYDDYSQFDDDNQIIVTKQISYEDAYRELENALNNGILEEFKDRNVYNIKFITSGGYANYGNLYNYEDNVKGEDKFVLSGYNKLLELASNRGDAIALMEFRPVFKDQETLLKELQSVSGDQMSAAFFPWCECNITAIGNKISVTEMPASYCYLAAYARSVRSNANWFAAAGVNRGSIPGMVKPLFEVGESLMHILQGDEDNTSSSIGLTVNPIFNAGSYGYRIWGNRMSQRNYQNLFKNFLNVRILLCDIKKQIYHAAMRVTFEPNDDIVWINFKTLVNSPLERMKSGRGISWYKWVREYTEEKAKIKATLIIRPIEAVENFEISVVLSDEDAVVEEAVAASAV